MRTETEHWQNLGARLSIEVVSPAFLNLAGRDVAFTALLPQFGASKGMIVDADGDLLWQHRKALTELGYGFSAVELGDTDEVESAQEMLRDWGWTGSEPVPAWW